MLGVYAVRVWTQNWRHFHFSKAQRHVRWVSNLAIDIHVAARFSSAVDGAARQVDKEVIGITTVFSRELLAQRKVAGLPNVRMCFASSWRRDFQQDVPSFLFFLESPRPAGGGS